MDKMKRMTFSLCLVALVSLLFVPVNADLQSRDKNFDTLQKIRETLENVDSLTPEELGLIKQQMREELRGLLTTDEEVALYRELQMIRKRMRIINQSQGGVAPLVAAPANDDCASATPVTFPKRGGLFQECVDTTAATSETGEDAIDFCNGSSGASIWYKLTAPADGSFDLSTFGFGPGRLITDYDTVIDVYDTTSCLPADTDEIAKNDDFIEFAGRSRTRFPVSKGDMVLVRVDGFFGASGTACVRFVFDRSGRGVIDACSIL